MSKLLSSRNEHEDSCSEISALTGMTAVRGRPDIENVSSISYDIMSNNLKGRVSVLDSDIAD